MDHRNVSILIHEMYWHVLSLGNRAPYWFINHCEFDISIV